MNKIFSFCFLILLSISPCKDTFSQISTEKYLLDDSLRQQIKDTSAFSVDTLTQLFKGDTFSVYKPYAYGKLVRWCRYYKGKINAIANYQDGKAHGNQYTYYKNGRLSGQTTYDKGNLISWIELYKDGKVKAVRVNDSIMGVNDSKEYYENGQLTRHQNTDLKTGVTRDVIYNLNGKVASDFLYGAGKQKAITYNENGQIVEEYSYIDITLNYVGECKFYYWDSGKIREHRFYKDGETGKEANIKTGIWKFWDENGNIIKKEFYDENGKLISVEE